MSNKSRQDLLNQVKANKKSLENQSVEDIDVLDVEYILDSNCDLKEIVLTLTTGGPRIDLKLNKKVLLGYWGGEKVDYPIFENEPKARSTIDQLWYKYSEQFKLNIS